MYQFTFIANPSKQISSQIQNPSKTKSIIMYKVVALLAFVGYASAGHAAFGVAPLAVHGHAAFNAIDLHAANAFGRAAIEANRHALDTINVGHANVAHSAHGQATIDQGVINQAIAARAAGHNDAVSLNQQAAQRLAINNGGALHNALGAAAIANFGAHRDAALNHELAVTGYRSYGVVPAVGTFGTILGAGHAVHGGVYGGAAAYGYGVPAAGVAFGKVHY